MDSHFASIRVIVIAFAIGACVSSPLAWKKEVHFLTLPFIEGLGIYSSTRILQDSQSSGTKASAIAGLSLLGIESGIGAAAIFGPQPNYPKLRRIHRYVGFALSAAALWMSISAGSDAHVENEARNFTHGFAIATTIPLIVFSF
jgi:hypothetical protein